MGIVTLLGRICRRPGVYQAWCVRGEVNIFISRKNVCMNMCILNNLCMHAQVYAHIYKHNVACTGVP